MSDPKITVGVDVEINFDGFAAFVEENTCRISTAALGKLEVAVLRESYRRAGSSGTVGGPAETKRQCGLLVGVEEHRSGSPRHCTRPSGHGGLCEHDANPKIDHEPHRPTPSERVGGYIYAELEKARAAALSDLKTEIDAMRARAEVAREAVAELFDEVRHPWRAPATNCQGCRAGRQCLDVTERCAWCRAKIGLPPTRAQAVELSANDLKSVLVRAHENGFRYTALVAEEYQRAYLDRVEPVATRTDAEAHAGFDRTARERAERAGDRAAYARAEQDRALADRRCEPQPAAGRTDVGCSRYKPPAPVAPLASDITTRALAAVAKHFRPSTIRTATDVDNFLRECGVQLSGDERAAVALEVWRALR